MRAYYIGFFILVIGKPDPDVRGIVRMQSGDAHIRQDFGGTPKPIKLKLATCTRKTRNPQHI